MFEGHNQAVFELLKDRDLVSTSELETIHREHRSKGKPLAAVAIDLGLIEPDVLLAQVADSLGCRYSANTPETLNATTVGLLEGEMARSYGVIPFLVERDAVEVLAVD